MISLALAGAALAARTGGNVAPDGTELSCDLPGDLHRRNTASKGLGLCVFTSIHHSAVYQNVPALLEFPKYLIDKGIPGGGYPEKVAELIPRLCAERGLPEPAYVQVQGDDLEVLKLACRNGRMPSVTYCWSPTGRYNGQKIAHMVSLMHADEKHFVVCDNNYVPRTDEEKRAPQTYEWLTPEEFRKSYTGMGGGWAVILLSPGPPAPPRN